MPLNLPNLLTWLRILLIPLFLGVFYFPDTWLSGPQKNLTATVLFAVAAAHRLAGRLSRAHAEPDLGLRRVSRSGGRQADGGGRADRAGLAGARGCDRSRSSSSAARSRSRRCANGWRRSAAARAWPCRFLGKIKTACQMVGDSAAALSRPSCSGSSIRRGSGTLLIYVAAVLTLWSMVYYLKMALPLVLAERTIERR